MNHAQIPVAPKIIDVEGKKLIHSIRSHQGDQACILNAHASNLVVVHWPFALYVDAGRIRYIVVVVSLDS